GSQGPEGATTMFGRKKKLYAEGVQTEGQVFGLTEYRAGGGSPSQGVKVRVKFPDGSVTEFEKGPLSASDVGYFTVGSAVPVRYDPAHQSKVVLDIPALKEKYARTEAAQQAQLDAQFAHMGQPGSPGLGGSADDRLAKLAELKQQGILTDDQFTAAKAKILGE